MIVCKTGVQDAQYMQAEDLLNQVVYLTHQTCSLWRVSAAHDPKLAKTGTLLAKAEEGDIAMNNRGKKMGLLLTGMALGATFCGGAAAAGIVAVPTRQPIYVDGQQVKMEAYNINGSNYVKLRDAGRQVGFNVYWDNGVQVDTGALHRRGADTR